VKKKKKGAPSNAKKKKDIRNPGGCRGGLGVLYFQCQSASKKTVSLLIKGEKKKTILEFPMGGGGGLWSPGKGQGKKSPSTPLRGRVKFKGGTGGKNRGSATGGGSLMKEKKRQRPVQKNEGRAGSAAKAPAL